MPTGRECFEAWAGDHEWSDWTKPTLFASELFAAYANVGQQSIPDTEHGALEMALRNNIRHRDDAGNRACLVVDMPDARAIRFGAALSQHGFAPLMLFNGVASARNPIIPYHDVVAALIRYAGGLRVAADPSPAFLLDSRRLDGSPMPGRYDNRWITFPQDFPSGGRLRSSGITRCYLVLEPQRIADDLAHVLKRWQDAGIEICDATNGQPLNVTTPPLYKTLYYRWLALVKLRPNSFGGFGAVIPLPGGVGYG